MMVDPNHHWFLSAPATSGNLGPGFDRMGLAYGLRLEIRARPAERFSVEPLGKDAGELPRDERNLILATYINECRRLGWPCPPLALTADNPIPIKGGLGSSATAIAGGLALAWLANGKEVDRQAVFERAATLEGHPDNVAPAIFGGLTLCGKSANGTFTSRPGTLADGIKVLLVTPDAQADTASMRKALPKSWPEEIERETDQLVQRLIAGLANADAEGLGSSQLDRKHQPYRFALQPEARRVFETLCEEPAAAGVFLSGSGPTVAAWILGEGRDLPDFPQRFKSMGIDTEVRLVDIDRAGLIAEIVRD